METILTIIISLRPKMVIMVFFDYESQRWCVARTECGEFYVYPCSINNPSLTELNDWVREDDDAIIGFFNGTVKFEEINND